MNMATHKHSHRSRHDTADSFESPSYFSELWDSFWYPPSLVCPKCGSGLLEYYDPFFFSPIRTLKGRRRVKCTACRFIWRPSSRKKQFRGLWPFK